MAAIQMDSWGLKRLFSHALRRWLSGARKPRDTCPSCQNYRSQFWSFPKLRGSFCGGFENPSNINKLRFAQPQDPALNDLWDVFNKAWGHENDNLDAGADDDDDDNEGDDGDTAAEMEVEEGADAAHVEEGGGDDVEESGEGGGEVDESETLPTETSEPLAIPYVETTFTEEECLIVETTEKMEMEITDAQIMDMDTYPDMPHVGEPTSPAISAEPAALDLPGPSSGASDTDLAHEEREKKLAKIQLIKSRVFNKVFAQQHQLIIFVGDCWGSGCQLFFIKKSTLSCFLGSPFLHWPLKVHHVWSPKFGPWEIQWL